MNNKKLSEKEQREYFLNKHNNQDEKLICEVPVFARSIDVVKYNQKTGLITALEFKLNDWKRAIKQALSVSICFDYLEICIPKPKLQKTQDNIIAECSKIGVGLYLFDEEKMVFDKIIEPSRVKEIWETQKKQVVEYVGRLD